MRSGPNRPPTVIFGACRSGELPQRYWLILEVERRRRRRRIPPPSLQQLTITARARNFYIQAPDTLRVSAADQSGRHLATNAVVRLGIPSPSSIPLILILLARYYSQLLEVETLHGSVGGRRCIFNNIPSQNYNLLQGAWGDVSGTRCSCIAYCFVAPQIHREHRPGPGSEVDRQGVRARQRGHPIRRRCFLIWYVSSHFLLYYWLVGECLKGILSLI